MVTHYFFQAAGAGSATGNTSGGIITFVKTDEDKIRCRYSVNEDIPTCIQRANEWGNSASWVPVDCGEWLPYKGK